MTYLPTCSSEYHPGPALTLTLLPALSPFFDQRDYVLPEDIKEVTHDVFNHRILLNYEAEADGVTTTDIIKAILKKVPINQ